MRLPDFSEEGRRTIVWVFLVAAVVGLAVAFLIRHSSPFLSSCLVGLSVNSLAVAFGLWAVDRYAEARRRQEWARVKRLTRYELCYHLMNLANCAGFFFRLQDGNHAALLDPKPGELDTTADATRVFTDEIRARVRSLRQEVVPYELWATLESQFRGFVQAISESCQHLQAAVLSLLVASQESQPLIEKLVEVGQGYRTLTSHLAATGPAGIPRELSLPPLLEDVTELLDRAAEAYKLAIAGEKPDQLRRWPSDVERHFDRLEWRG